MSTKDKASKLTPKQCNAWIQIPQTLHYTSRMTKTLQLVGKYADGRSALVDEDVWKWAKHFTWFVSKNGYVTTRTGGKSKTLHSMIMEPPKGMDVDHIRGDKLDNRRKSLRIATRAQNAQNRPKRTGCMSPYKGVTKHHLVDKWQARVRDGTKNVYLGLFITQEEAAHAYDIAARRIYGAGARLNFGEPT